jgi:hypothetical protein
LYQEGNGNADEDKADQYTHNVPRKIGGELIHASSLPFLDVALEAPRLKLANLV